MLSRSFWKAWCRRLFQTGSRRRNGIGNRRRGSGREFSRSYAAEVLEVRTLLSTITVTSLADNASHNGFVTLRDALTAANTDKSVNGSTAGITNGEQ